MYAYACLYIYEERYYIKRDIHTYTLWCVHIRCLCSVCGAFAWGPSAAPAATEGVGLGFRAATSVGAFTALASEAGSMHGMGHLEASGLHVHKKRYIYIHTLTCMCAYTSRTHMGVNPCTSRNKEFMYVLCIHVPMFRSST